MGKWLSLVLSQGSSLPELWTPAPPPCPAPSIIYSLPQIFNLASPGFFPSAHRHDHISLTTTREKSEVTWSDTLYLELSFLLPFTVKSFSTHSPHPSVTILLSPPLFWNCSRPGTRELTGSGHISSLVWVGILSGSYSSFCTGASVIPGSVGFLFPGRPLLLSLPNRFLFLILFGKCGFTPTLFPSHCLYISFQAILLLLWFKWLFIYVKVIFLEPHTYIAF